jgi:TolB protein
MAADGTDDRWLVDGGSVPAFPRWQPDGQWIAAESGGAIVAVHKDGYAAGWVYLTNASDDLVPAWAPSGRRFATATSSGIRIYRADGGSVRDLAALLGAYRLDRSPDGGSIAVEAQGDLWMVALPSGAVRRLTNAPNVQETSPVWSPDGRWPAYGRGPGAHNPDLPGLTTDPVIWLMRRDGSHRRSTSVPGVPSSWRTAG